MSIIDIEYNLMKACSSVVRIYNSWSLGHEFEFWWCTMSLSICPYADPVHLALSPKCAMLNLPKNHVKGTYICGVLSYLLVNPTSMLFHWSIQVGIYVVSNGALNHIDLIVNYSKSNWFFLNNQSQTINWKIIFIA